MRRGEVWLISLDPTIGAEIQKTRPVVIISSDAIGVLPLRVVIPLTDWKSRYQNAHWIVHLEPSSTNGLKKPSGADTFQIRSVSTQRFIRKLGELDEAEVQAVAAAVALVIEHWPKE